MNRVEKPAERRQPVTFITLISLYRWWTVIVIIISLTLVNQFLFSTLIIILKKI